MSDATDTGATATLDDVASSVADLQTSVEEMKEGRVDRSTVEAMVKDAVEKSGQVRGYQPDPVALDEKGNPVDVERALGADPQERFVNMLTLPARETAAVLRCDVETLQNFRTKADDLVLLSAILAGRGKVQSPKETKFYGSQFLPAMRAAVDTVTEGEGAEFVPRELSSQLIDRVNLALRVVQLFPEVTMPTNPFDLPARALARVRGGRHTEQTADTGQTKIKKVTPGSRKITLEAAKFATTVLSSKEASEDEIIAVLAFLREELLDLTAADLEDAANNGDTAEEHRDPDSDEADDPRKNWDGIRKVANANETERDHENKALMVAGLRANRKLMGKYGIDPGQLAHVIGLTSYIDLLSDENVQTVDKYGAQATVLTGELGRADGVPLVVSEYVREDLNAEGVRDEEGEAPVQNRSTAATVHRRAFVRGTRRMLSVEFYRELYAEEDQDGTKISTRQALTERYTGDPAVAVTINVATT